MRDPGDTDEAVLAVVQAIPAGQLAAYGDIARIVTALGIRCSARQVARVLREFGSGLPWWRVVRSDGTLAPQVADRAGTALRVEGIAVEGLRVPLVTHCWQPDLDALAQVMPGSPS